MFMEPQNIISKGEGFFFFFFWGGGGVANGLGRNGSHQSNKGRKVIEEVPQFGSLQRIIVDCL